MDDFSIDILGLVFRFLAPRDLLNISQVNRNLRSSIRTREVVISGLFHGGNAAKSIRNMIPLLKNKAIYCPSPMRLLRLTCGKKCEFCFGKHVNQSKKHLERADQLMFENLGECLPVGIVYVTDGSVTFQRHGRIRV